MDDPVNAMVANMDHYIELPKDRKEIKRNAEEFARYGYPHVYGAIDGTPIDVTVPDDLRLDYFTRKYNTSINFTGADDARKKVISITTGFSGKVHDSHIFQCSKFGQQVLRDVIIPRQYHLLGDAAYGLHQQIMVPYNGHNLSAV